MIFLKALNASLAAITVLNSFNSFYSRNSLSERCDVAYLVLQTNFADCLPVLSVVAFCFWCVDYKANFFVHNHIYNIRATSTNLVYYIALNSVCVVEVCGALSTN